MSGKLSNVLLLSILALAMAGCVHAISRQNRQFAIKGLTPDVILRDFETYQGKLVLIGGEIIKTKNLEQETLIEVLQRPLSRNTDRPLKDKAADGRFIVKYNTFKDPYVFSQGKEITVAGIVIGKEVSKIDQKEYTYAVLENRETHLWPERVDYYEPYPYGYPYYPYWYPYYPWWHHHYFYHRRHWH